MASTELASSLSSDNCFYEELGVDEFHLLAQSAGVSTCADLKVVTSLVTSFRNVLDVGFGYGRVIQFMLDNFPDATVYGIEKSSYYYSHVTSSLPSMNLIHGDFLDYCGGEKFDLVLFMWSTLADFNSGEKVAAFSVLKNILSADGVAVIDLFTTDSVPEHGSMLASNYAKVQVGDSLEKILHVLSASSLNEIADQNSLECYKHVEYQAGPHVRQLFFIRHKKI